MGTTEQSDAASQGMTESAPGRAGTEIEVKQPVPQIGLYNGLMSPDRWSLFGRIAYAIKDTEFVGKAMRKRPDAIMACLLYGDSLNLHPSVSLTDVYIVDGHPGISGALMLAKIREAGHKIRFEELYDDQGVHTGATAYGERIKDGEVEETDEWTYTIEDAIRAGLLPNSSPKAAWNTVPKVMCRWRALAQLARFLFPDVFRGQAIYTPDEAEEIAHAAIRARNGAPVVQADPEQEEEQADYGSDPALASWLVALFAAANEVEAGVWLPKKVAMTLKGKTQEEREQFAQQLAAWIGEHDAVVPERPGEEIEDADFETINTSGDSLEGIIAGEEQTMLAEDGTSM